ncbi:acetyl CoA--N6-hydroxylysine acetyl transferase, partial [Paraburkholderia sp. Se-20369]|nr:acetyl CoA--N6-hydroxylysine acetyl transferase [Paraburkholderia sp. Se-20369]
MNDTLTNPADAAPAAEDAAAVAIDFAGAAHDVDRVLDAWRPDDPPAA